MGGDYFLGAVLATSLTKLVLRAQKIGKDQTLVNQLRAEAMLIMTGVINVGQSKFVTVPIDEDSYDRILTCLRVLGGADGSVHDVFMKHCREVYSQLMKNEEVRVTRCSVGLMPDRKRRRKRQRRDSNHPKPLSRILSSSDS